jgi:hypothetical protein
MVKSSALRLKNFIEISRAYLRLCFEIFVAHPDKYSSKATPVLPPGVGGGSRGSQQG